MARLDLFVRRCCWPAGIALVLTCMCWVCTGVAQETPTSETAGKKAAQSAEGFPVTNSQVIASCSGCHARDAKGNMTRISWIRTTPEGWEEAIKRMVRLHGAKLEPDDARKI